MHPEYKKAFKAYDIRGVYGKEIDENFAYTMGKVIGKYMIEKFGKGATLLIGCDVREKSVTLITAFEKGISDTTPDIQISYAAFESSEDYPYGICSSAVLYYIGQKDFDLSVCCTASHNPPEHVGLKFFDKEVIFVASDFLWDLFQKAYSDAPLPLLEKPSIKSPSAKIIEKKNKFFTFLDKKFDLLQQKFTLSIDFSNGAAGTVEKEFIETHLHKHTCFLINAEPDWDFKAHISDTSVPEFYAQLQKDTIQHKSDLGIMFDGDADRIGFVDNEGEIIELDFILAIMARHILEYEEPQGKILYDLTCSRIVAETIEKYKGTPIMTKMWRFFIKEIFDKEQWSLGGETSGHFMFRSIGGHECTLLALYYVLQVLEKYPSSHEMIHHYRKYHKGIVRKVYVKDKQKIIEKVKEKYQDEHTHTLDGISVHAEWWRLNVRGSNTESIIRYTVEADTQETREKIMEELETLIHEANKE